MKNLGILFGFILILFSGFVFWTGTPYRYLMEGSTDLTSGKVAKAIETLNDGLNHYPDNDEIAFLLAKACLSSGEYEDANKVVKDKQLFVSLKGNKEFQDFLVDLAEANQRAGDLKLASFFAKKYLSIQPDESSKRLVKNQIKIGQILTDETEAVKIWEGAFNVAAALKENELKESLRGLLMPKYLQLVKDLRAEKKNEDALDVLERAEVLGKNAEVTFQEALIYRDLEKIEIASKKFEEAIQIEDENDEYKIAYAEALEQAASKSDDKEKKKEYAERAKLLIGDGSTDQRKSSLLSKIINLNAKFKVQDGAIKVSRVGDFLYPTISFKIDQVSDIEIRSYRVIFFEGSSQIDIYESSITQEELNQLIEVTSRNPISENKEVSARLFLNKEFIAEFKTLPKADKKIEEKEVPPNET